MAAMKRLWFQQIDSMGQFPDGRIKLEVTFKDDLRQVYVWTPRWKEEVEPLFLAGLRVEKTNRPKSDYLRSFAETAKDAFQEASDVSDACAAEGKLVKIEGNSLLLCQGFLVARDPFSAFSFYKDPKDFHTAYCGLPFDADRECNRRLAVGFPISEDWLLENLGQMLKCLVINGIVVRTVKKV